MYVILFKTRKFGQDDMIRMFQLFPMYLYDVSGDVDKTRTSWTVLANDALDTRSYFGTTGRIGDD